MLSFYAYGLLHCVRIGTNFSTRIRLAEVVFSTTQVFHTSRHTYLYKPATGICIAAGITFHQYNMRTQPLRLIFSHTRFDAVFPCFIRRRGNDRSFIGTDHRNGFSPQGWVYLLLNGGKEGIHVDMHNGSL